MAISYHGDVEGGGAAAGGGGGGGGGVEGVCFAQILWFGECHLQALMMIRVAAGVNNMGALKY